MKTLKRDYVRVNPLPEAETVLLLIGDWIEGYNDNRILGACNPQLAHRALSTEDKIGAMLPCNVIVQAIYEGIEIAAIDLSVAMASVDNPALAPLAADVRAKPQRVINAL